MTQTVDQGAKGMAQRPEKKNQGDQTDAEGLEESEAEEQTNGV